MNFSILFICAMLNAPHSPKYSAYIHTYIHIWNL